MGAIQHQRPARTLSRQRGAVPTISQARGDGERDVSATAGKRTPGRPRSLKATRNLDRMELETVRGPSVLRTRRP